MPVVTAKKSVRKRNSYIELHKKGKKEKGRKIKIFDIKKSKEKTERTQTNNKQKKSKLVVVDSLLFNWFHHQDISLTSGNFVMQI